MVVAAQPYQLAQPIDMNWVNVYMHAAERKWGQVSRISRIHTPRNE